MAKQIYDNLIEGVWSRAKECDCGDANCHPNNHRLCALCDNTILYQAHESNGDHAGGWGGWNIDHIIPKSKGGNDNKNNLQATHIKCNQKKSNNW